MPALSVDSDHLTSSCTNGPLSWWREIVIFLTNSAPDHRCCLNRENNRFINRHAASRRQQFARESTSVSGRIRHPIDPAVRTFRRIGSLVSLR
jgi:hypothetical protein